MKRITPILAACMFVSSAIALEAEPAAPAPAPTPAPPDAAKPVSEPPAPQKSVAKPKPKPAAPHESHEMSHKAYMQALAAEIRRHTPKTSEVQAGSLTVAFTIGASGRVVSHSIKHASDPALSAVAAKILASIHTPPPPGGKFSAVQEFVFR